MDVNKTGNMYGLGIKMSGGHVADVHIENCTSTRGDMNCNGCAIYQAGGLVERCVLRNNQGKQYGALYLAGGTNAHAIIYGNTARNGGATGGGVSSR